MVYKKCVASQVLPAISAANYDMGRDSAMKSVYKWQFLLWMASILLMTAGCTGSSTPPVVSPTPAPVSTPTPAPVVSPTPTPVVTPLPTPTPIASPTPTPTKSTRNYSLYITAGTLTVNGLGGDNLPAWGYTDVQGGPPKFPGPALIAHPGDVVSVTVTNTLATDHNFMIAGITSDTSPIPRGASKTYTFTATDSNAGSHVYYDTLNNSVNREMGLYGAMIIKPASNNLWTGGPVYTSEYTWVVGDMDKANWNDKAGNGAAVNTTLYQPNYFLINGMGGFDAQVDANTSITGKVGDTVLVRIVNGGQFQYSMHFHANHVKVAALNGVALSAPFKQLDVVSVPALGTVDLLYDLNQPGDYLMHVHNAQGETANGVYLNGIMAMVHIQ